MTNKYKLKKVFDCQDMPEDLKLRFFKWCEQGNDSFTYWEVHGWDYGQLDEEDLIVKDIDEWLVANGAEAGTETECGETVLILHWW